MVSAEEIGGVTVFTDLDATERERLSRAAADISLVPGEYAAHEGDERAIFAVLEGRIEAVKTLDGAARGVGERLPRARPAPRSAGTRPAPSCGASWTATRSPSSGSRRRPPIRPTGGAAPCRPRRTGRQYRPSKARPRSGPNSAGWPSCSA